MAMPSASRRKRRAQFLALAPGGGVRNADFNTPSTEWQLVCEEWIEVQDMVPSRGERIAEGVNISARPCRIRMLFRDDITSGMRVKLPDEGNRMLHLVTEPAELGFREGLEIVAEQLSVSGDLP